MRSLICAILALIIYTSETNAQDVCENPVLLDFFQTIGSACKTGACDVSVMAQIDSRVDRSDLLGALRNPALGAVHLFYPSARYQLDEAFDWGTTKGDQLKTIASISNRHEDAIVYVIGKASNVGNADFNIRLSRDRARGVVEYMRANVSDKFHHYHTAWAGEDAFQLNHSHARTLNLEPLDFRDDGLILNQSVHVFIYPCADVLESHMHAN